jgi:hypothetical protein
MAQEVIDIHAAQEVAVEAVALERFDWSDFTERKCHP